MIKKKLLFSQNYNIGVLGLEGQHIMYVYYV